MGYITMLDITWHNWYNPYHLSIGYRVTYIDPCRITAEHPGNSSSVSSSSPGCDTNEARSRSQQAWHPPWFTWKNGGFKQLKLGNTWKKREKRGGFRVSSEGFNKNGGCNEWFRWILWINRLALVGRAQETGCFFPINDTGFLERFLWIFPSSDSGTKKNCCAKVPDDPLNFEKWQVVLICFDARCKQNGPFSGTGKFALKDPLFHPLFQDHPLFEVVELKWIVDFPTWKTPGWNTHISHTGTLAENLFDVTRIHCESQSPAPDHQSPAVAFRG